MSDFVGLKNVRKENFKGNDINKIMSEVDGKNRYAFNIQSCGKDHALDLNESDFRKYIYSAIIGDSK